MCYVSIIIFVLDFIFFIFYKVKIKYRANVSNEEYKDNLRTELKLRVLHNQHEVNSIKATVNEILATRRVDEINDQKMSQILNKLNQINSKHPCTEHDKAMEEMSQSGLLELDFLAAMRQRDILGSNDHARLMKDHQNKRYRELCDSDIDENDFHDHNIK